MPASIRPDPSVDAFRGYATRDIPKPPGVQAGDVLLMVHSSNADAAEEMSASGGWVTIATETSGGTDDTKVYRRVATSSEPASYQVTQSSSGDTIVVLFAVKDGSAAGLRIVPQSGPTTLLGEVITPAAAPSTGDGLDIRIAVGFRVYTASLSWQVPDGYTAAASAQSRLRMASIVASRPLVTSAPVGEVPFRVVSGLNDGHGFTILIPSGTSAPTPPHIPDAAPGRGSSVYRFTAHDLLTGDYITDVQPNDCTFDARIGEPGTIGMVLPVPNQRRAEQVAQIVPRVGSDLSTGPGRLAMRVWRAGALWGEYWIHGAKIKRTRRGNIDVTLRGSTLDALLYNVPIETDVSYGGEQIANMRSLVNHMQALSGANLGITVPAGTSGVTRTLSAAAKDDPTYGDALADFAKGFNGFEHTMRAELADDGTVARVLAWGYPRITSDTVHVVAESPNGGDVLEWEEEIDALRGATRIRVRGGTPEVTDAEEGSEPVYSGWVSATAHLAAGWPRYGRRIDHPGESTSTSTLNSYAARWIATMGGAVRVHSCTVALGLRTTLSPSALGDMVRRVMVNEWLPRVDGAAGVNQEQRLIGIAITPIIRGKAGREEAQLILEEPTVADIADDRFPTEHRRIIRRLQKDNDRLSTEAKRVAGVPIPRAGDVPNPPSFSSPSVQSGEFCSGSAYTALRGDTAELHDTVRDLMNELRASGLLGG